MKNIFSIFIYLVYFNGFHGSETVETCSCYVSIRHLRLLTNIPIYLYAGTDTTIYPYNRTIKLSTGQNIEAHCTKPGFYIDREKHEKISYLSLKCLYRRKFLIRGKVIDLAFLECMHPVLSKSRVTSLNCGHSPRQTNKLIYVGFELSGEKFIKQYTVCFDMYRQMTQFIYSTIIPIKTKSVPIVTRKPLKDDFFYLQKSVYLYYSTLNQQRAVNKLMGVGLNCTWYIDPSKNITLIKSSLLSMEDYVYGYEKDALRYYMNIVPVWHKLHQHSWRGINKFAHKYAVVNNVTLLTYTGTYGLMYLEEYNEKLQIPIYLATISRTKLLPVPGYVWKLLYDKVHSAGVVIIVANSKEGSNITKICYDISPSITNLKSYVDASEHVFACTINAWSKVVKNTFPYFYVEKVLGAESLVHTTPSPKIEKDNASEPVDNTLEPIAGNILSKIINMFSNGKKDEEN